MTQTPNTPTTARIAEPDDADVIADFTRSIAWETEQIQLDADVVNAGVRAVFDDPNLGFYVVAVDSGQVVGCLMITYEWSDWRNGVQWWLQSVYVRPDHRRQGIFETLFRFITELASNRPDVCGVRLYVEKHNKVAQSTYQSIGMTATNYLVYETALHD